MRYTRSATMWFEHDNYSINVSYHLPYCVDEENEAQKN